MAVCFKKGHFCPHFLNKKWTTLSSSLSLLAYILPNLSPTIIHSKEKSLHPSSPPPPPLLLPPPPPRQASSLSVPTKQQHPHPHLFLHHPTTCAIVIATVALASPQDNKQHDHRDDFFVNLGLAVWTLREDLPLLFTKNLNYDIYRYSFPFSTYSFNSCFLCN